MKMEQSSSGPPMRSQGRAGLSAGDWCPVPRRRRRRTPRLRASVVSRLVIWSERALSVETVATDALGARDHVVDEEVALPT